MKNVYKILIFLVLMTGVTLTPIQAASTYHKVSLDIKSNTTTVENKNIEDDLVKPTLSAAISDGVLSIQGSDVGSGIASIYVNSYEYVDLQNGALNIRLQQFDAGYQYFTIQAKDLAGNASDVYKIKNPYYIDPAFDKDKKDAAIELKETLPLSAIATNPTDAKATVIGHTQMVPMQTTIDNPSEPVSENVETEVVETNEGAGKEFYTIQTNSDKVFYLIIDKSQKENNVYLLTEVSENDLLNFSVNDSKVLPQNSAVVEVAVPISNNVIVKAESDNLNAESEIVTEDAITIQTDTEEIANTTESKSSVPSNTGNYIMIGIVVIVVGGFGVYNKLIKGKKDQYDDEDFEEEEEYENEEMNEEFEDEDMKD